MSSPFRFYPGLQRPGDGEALTRYVIARHNASPTSLTMPADDWILDSGGYLLVANRGGYPAGPKEYVRLAERFAAASEEKGGRMAGAIAEDYNCTNEVCEVVDAECEGEHLDLSVQRYRAHLEANPAVEIWPVLHGWAPSHYLWHLEMYGDLIGKGATVAIGSLKIPTWCSLTDGPHLDEKRPRNAAWLGALAHAIKKERPDLKLHALGVGKRHLTTKAGRVARRFLASADSSAWSLRARYAGRSPTDPAEAEAYRLAVDRLPGGDLSGGLFHPA